MVPQLANFYRRDPGPEPASRWQDILEDIRKLQEKIKELVAWSNGKIGKGELGLDVSDLFVGHGIHQYDHLHALILLGCAPKTLS